MKIMISPAKKMKIDTDSFASSGTPQFIEDTRILMGAVRALSLPEAKALWKCNDKLAELNYRRFQEMDLDRALTPAVLSYEGLQYQHLAPEVLSEKGLGYIDEHLRILSGFYGILKPFDQVTPYRLEMQARLAVQGSKNLYEFWGDRLYESIVCEDRVILNLASKEYSRCVEKYVTSQDRLITVEFGSLVNGKVKQKATLSKMARGEMVRFLAENGIDDPEGIKEFRELGFAYADAYSDESTYVFLNAE